LTVWFLAFLAAAWVIVYLPSVWRARQTSPFPAVQRFKRNMRSISPRARVGRWVIMPESRERVVQLAFERAQTRRKRILIGLVSVALGTGVWAVVAGGIAVELHLIVDALAAFYVALILDANRKRTEREVKVRTLAPPRAPSLREAEHFEVLEAGGGRSS
jgi:hypothetical protein